MNYEKCIGCLKMCDCCEFKSDKDKCSNCRPFGKNYSLRDGMPRCPSLLKYKIGDKVRVRNDLVVSKGYKMDYNTHPTTLFTEDMSRYIGKVVTIDRIGGMRYHIKESDIAWYWVDEMFEAGVVEIEN